MLTFVNAKINLGLRIVRRLPTGYHQLETIFYPVGLHNGTPQCPYPFCDILEVTSGTKEFILETGDWKEVASPDDNIVSKSWRLFSQICRERGIAAEGCRVRLEKHLPSQAGMGGGSADAVYALRMYNHLYGNPLDDYELHTLAIKIGSDCPFFLRNTPSLGQGTGELLTPVEPRLEGMWCAIVKPRYNMPTRRAFAMITPSGEENGLLPLYLGDIRHWRDGMVNDFEQPFLHLYPDCTHIKEQLYADGAIYASLSGSGAAFYGIFHSREQALVALEHQTTPYKALALL